MAKRRQVKVMTLDAGPQKRVPPPKRKKRRGRHSGTLVLIYIMLALAAVVTLVVLSLTVWFPITTIQVTGSSRYTKEEIISAGGIQKNVNFFLCKTGPTKESLPKSLPYIASVKVEKKFPSTIRITVSEAAPVGQIQSGGQYILFDKEDKCLEVTDIPAKDVPIVRGCAVQQKTPGEAVALSGEDGEQKMDALKEIYRCLKSNEIEDVTVITLADVQDVLITCNDKIVLKCGSTGNLDKKLQYAKLILEEQAQGYETGILNLSRIAEDKQQAYFTAATLPGDQMSATTAPASTAPLAETTEKKNA